MPRAKNKIYYDIDESEYFVKTDTMTFYFTKVQNIDRFNEGLESNRETIQERLEYLHGVKISCNDLCDLKLYSTIEKKKFRVYDKGGCRLWQTNLIFSGGIKTL